MVIEEYDPATSHRTLDPLLVMEVTWFLSSADCPDAEVWRQATTNIMQSMMHKELIFFMGYLTFSRIGYRICLG
jgi:hypothetical protein